MKFSDYFEFPREFNMAPYTAATLAKLEGGVCAVIIIVNIFIDIFANILQVCQLFHLGIYLALFPGSTPHLFSQYNSITSFSGYIV